MGYFVWNANDGIRVRVTDSRHDKLDLASYRETLEDAWLLAFDLKCEAIVQRINALICAMTKLHNVIVAIDDVGKYDLCGCYADMFGRSHICGHDERRAAFASLYEQREHALGAARAELAYFLPVCTWEEAWRHAESIGLDSPHKIDRAWLRHDGTLYVFVNDRLVAYNGKQCIW